MLLKQFSLGFCYNIGLERLVPDVNRCQVMLGKLKIYKAYKGRGSKNLEPLVM